MPAISVIVVNWNGRDLLQTCLSSLAAQTFQDFEVILVDNASTDGSVEFVARLFPWVKVVPLSDNFGFCGGNNRGLEYARYKYVVLLNNDTETHPAFLQALHEAAESDPEVGLCASRMLRFNERSRIDNCGIGLLLFGKGYEIGASQMNGARFQAPRYVFGACAGAALYRREMLERIGGFDEDFFSHIEDTDLSWRAQMTGYRCLYVPQAIVYHVHGATSVGISEQVLYRIQRNKTWAYLKNMPLLALVATFPLHLLYCFYWLLRAIRNGQGRIVWRANLDIIRSLPAVLAKRRYIQARKRLGSYQLLKLMDWRRK